MMMTFQMKWNFKKKTTENKVYMPIGAKRPNCIYTRPLWATKKNEKTTVHNINLNPDDFLSIEDGNKR